ncbi:hypothetical protein AVEN_108807-1 [Araneus ventricosus]|uniref:Uncharacterized protein n=1 Tax=Araneus ventricosus TaxID=182803 RepID=A0A4Y2CDE1_ARAVE|nr:hypothetical protein AVEN_108807-1 [Araneus ventricosus]
MLLGKGRNPVSYRTRPISLVPEKNAFPLDDTFAKPRLTRPSPVTGQEPFQVQKSSPNQDITGIFDSNFHGPSQKLMGWEMTNSIFSPATAQSGAKKKGGGGDIMHSSSWGMPEEVGTFGRFVDFDEDVPVLTRKQGLIQSSGGWSEPLLPSPSYELYAIGESCLQTVNKYCMADEQCTCAGRDVLRCHHGKCISYHMNNGTLKLAILVIIWMQLCQWEITPNGTFGNAGYP